MRQWSNICSEYARDTAPETENPQNLGENGAFVTPLRHQRFLPDSPATHAASGTLVNMRNRDDWAAVAMTAFFVWTFSSVIPGWGDWLALPAAAVWLTATVLSTGSRRPGTSSTAWGRLRRNAKWMPGVVVHGAAAVATAWWLLPRDAPFTWSLAGVGVLLPPVAASLFATGRIGAESEAEEKIQAGADARS